VSPASPSSACAYFGDMVTTDDAIARRGRGIRPAAGPAPAQPLRGVLLLSGVFFAGATATGAPAARDTPPPATLVDHPIASGMDPVYLDGSDWTLKQAYPPSDKSGAPPPPPARGPVSATVPGDVLSDLQRANVTPDPYFNVTWTDPAFVAVWNTGTWT
jgi:hypothetical protein